MDNLGYQYKYDYRNRMVEKKLPGKQWEFIVYDKLDRVVATGPANSPFSDLTSVGWLVTKYDAFNRPVITGWLSATVTVATRKILQDAQNALTSNFNETKIATATNTIVPATTGVKFRYDNAAWPTSGYHVMSVNYYDDYNFPDAPATIPATVAANTAGVSQVVYYNATTKPIGRFTGSWVRVPDLSTNYKYEQTYSLYDEKARLVRSYTQNFLGGFTCLDNKLDTFSGQLQYTITTHSRLSTDPVLKTTDTFTYSAQDRLKTHTHQIGTGTLEVIANNSYDELGQLISKKVGSNTQNINYTYNIRGWMTGINDVTALTIAGDPKDLFAFKINYNNTPGITGGKALYNGNIAETFWISTSETTPVIRGYAYLYDNLNRLKTSIYKRDAVISNTIISNAYSENLTYDKNGNIGSLTRNGNSETATQIDALVYTYTNSNTTNQLLKVVDSAPAATKIYGFADSAANTDDYSYDANGNMTKDNNKNITAITYNHLNLPTKITFATAGNIAYLYNATGQKVQKIVKEDANETITEYLGGYQYVKTPATTTMLKFFPTAEGYVEVSGSSYKYVYQYKDHLGNIRLSYDKNLTIQDENQYYPFGLQQKRPTDVMVASNYKYKFLGQERQDELGLNWDTFRHRNYDYAIGRFFGVDPVSEEYMSISTYQFAHNNPVWKIEIEGLEGAPSNGKQDISNHEPIKVKNTPMQGFLGGGLIETKVIQKTTTEVVKEVAVETTKKGGGLLLKGLGTVLAVLTDYMSPNYGGRTSEMPSKFGIDEKFSVKDYKIEEKTVEETGIKRFFEDNSKHGKDKKGRAGKAPENPQEVLDDSFELPGNTTRRVGVDYETGEFNVFDEHSEGKFHGHVRTWNELSQDMKNILLKQKVVTKKGKIINQE
ncbi:RHS repeat-associated core domain-containing protein [Flavobacterium cupreum]|uniref:RHS repeat-associated core domain-containing protein n=1 Tax=Flavobacterium cupreum TaxID=2133766 RepID=A0A434AB55_9FLAO|nr:RHS repeat-associated core domain-containing protein [Flavobacterium cupreum]